jgi:hypothetical protein
MTAASLNESAVQYFMQGALAEANTQLQQALLIKPDYHEAWYNMALVSLSLNRPFDAMLCCDRALACKQCAPYHSLRGVCLMKLNCLQEAVECYEEATYLDSSIASIWANKGIAHRLGGFLEDSIEYHAEAVNLEPYNTEYRTWLSMAYLQAGDLKHGWEESGHRIQVRTLPLPEWTGHRTGGVVLYCEQGLGDVVQFMRFAPVIKRMYEIKIWLEVKKPLLRLARTLRGIDGVIEYGDEMPDGATHCLSVINTPKWCHCDTFDDIPTAPYLGQAA